jgi:hypothetical protein
MAWLKLDDQFAENPKVSSLTNRSFRVHVAALCYCARNLTDGHLDSRAVNVVLAIVGTRSKTVLQELVSSALWRQETDGYSINDYLEYNPSAEQVKDERNKAAQRMRRIRSGQRTSERSPEVTPHVRGPRPVPSPSTSNPAAAATPQHTPNPAAAALQQQLDDLGANTTTLTYATNEPERTQAWLNLAHREAHTNPAAFILAGLKTGDWPSPRGRPHKPVTLAPCIHCGLGGGNHTTDCPNATKGAA